MYLYYDQEDFLFICLVVHYLVNRSSCFNYRQYWKIKLISFMEFERI